MAERLEIKVKCHACGYEMQGTARYGAGHYVPEGIQFEFVATGKIKTEKGRRVKGEVSAICPKCQVKNRFQL